jgi:hypothetical protein
MTHEDPVVRSGRREAMGVFCIWLLALSYSMGYSIWHGYHRSLDDLKLVFGFPDWVFWGIVVPWTICLVISWWFAYFFMTDEPFGEVHESVDGPVDEWGDAGHAS